VKGRIVSGNDQRRDVVPETTLGLVKVAALGWTRAALGVGVGLLLADRLDPRTRRTAGAALLAVGVVTTVPLVVSIVKGVASPATPSG
jgi:hypothetical protein